MKDLEITINIKLMNSNRLTPNYWVMLYYIYHGIGHKLGDMTKGSLIKLGFLDTKGELTDKARDLFKVDLKDLNDGKMKEWLLELRDIFPRGVKINNSPVRSAVGLSTVRKMRKFIKEYGYSDEVIRQAITAYVAAKKRDNYDFMMKFTNFIDKQGVGSELASFCELVVNGDDKINNDGETRITKLL